MTTSAKYDRPFLAASASQSKQDAEANEATGCQMDEVYSLLTSVFTLTQTLCESADKIDSDRLVSLLGERERMVVRLTELKKLQPPGQSTAGARWDTNTRFVQFVHAILSSNTTLMDILRKRKERVLEDLKELQKQKLIVSYAR